MSFMKQLICRAIVLINFSFRISYFFEQFFIICLITCIVPDATRIINDEPLQDLSEFVEDKEKQDEIFNDI